MYRFFIIASSILLSTQSASASQPRITMYVDIETQFGNLMQSNLSALVVPSGSGPSPTPTPTPPPSASIEFGSFEGHTDEVDDVLEMPRKHNSAIVNNTSIRFLINGRTDNGISYGGNIELLADTSVSTTGNSHSAQNVWTYIETKYGRIEAANTESAVNKMTFNANKIARATGGINGDANLWFDQELATDESIIKFFTIYPGLPSYSKAKSTANKIVYYSPKLYGFQIGASYTLDSHLRGTVYQLNNNDNYDNLGFNKIIDTTVTYEKKYDDFGFGFSVGGEIGKSNNTPGNPEKEDLKAIIYGSKITYKSLNIAASYSDWMKSANPVVKSPDGKFGAKHWTSGISYNKDDFGISLTHMKSLKANAYYGKASTSNNQDKSYSSYEIYSLGTDYKIADGMLAYGEFSKFYFNRSGVDSKSTGSVLLVGTRLNF